MFRKGLFLLALVLTALFAVSLTPTDQANVAPAVQTAVLAGSVNTANASSSQNQVIGNWAAVDLSQGGHAGGPIYANGVLGGGGFLNIMNGQEQGRLTNATWTFSSDSTPSALKLNICLTVTPLPGKDPLGILAHPFCFSDLPANTGPFNLTLADGFTTHFVLNIRA